MLLFLKIHVFSVYQLSIVNKGLGFFNLTSLIGEFLV